MKNWINGNWFLGGKIHAFPVIVDDLLREEKLKAMNLKVNLVEEILSQCAYRTYIFLDTMSTSYELGEFTNFALGENSVRVFVDEEFGTRVNCPVGDYLRMAIGKNLNTYPADYNGRGHLSFKGNRLPNEIKRVISQDNPCLPGYKPTIPITFLRTGQSTAPFGTFVVQPQGHGFTFVASPKTWFYFFSLVQSKHYRVDLSALESPHDPKFLDFIEKVKVELCHSFCALDHGIGKMPLLGGHPAIELVCSVFQNEFFYHCAALLGLIKGSVSSGPNGVSYVSTALASSEFRDIGDLSAFCLVFDSVTNYLGKNKETITQGVTSKTLVIKSKRRNITCYSSNKHGRDLRMVHERILSGFLSFLPTSACSFAYKEGSNTLSCIKAHEGNTEFAKFDIHDYFESIKLDAVVRKIQSLFVPSSGGNPLFPRLGNEAIGLDIKKILRPLFFNRSLPIGYVTSPIISDFYLYDLDEAMKSINGVVYTRYADDILLSSKDPERLKDACKFLFERLKAERLSINKAKTINKSLAHFDDSIRFLGINMVKRQNWYEYTVSRQYLVKTSKLIEKVEAQNNNPRLQGAVFRPGL